ncbi:putative peptidoglycan flippase MurJ [Rhodococcus sp. MTM3W5.2]|nr:putative peptidoglycan flippase MurJ [Rhodococcus sp. MTM3W5.2]
MYSPQQYPDNALASGLAIDGNLETAWSTDTYMQQFPQFKNGVGLTVALPPDTALRGCGSRRPPREPASRYEPSPRSAEPSKRPRCWGQRPCNRE